ncbi:MAG TPA: phytase [Xanthomonadaceae bacterium]|nr:phytase [Xanthomonadaceae bacterium]
MRLPAATLPLLLMLLLVTACATLPPPRATPDATAVEVAFVSESFPEDEIDSLAVWKGAAGERWLIATSKRANRLLVFDARDGRRLRRVGRYGDARGRFHRPNGIAIAGDLLLVAERDNRRVQVMTLPDFRSLGWFGDEVLRSPYGLWVMPVDEHRFRVFVTDSYMDVGIVVPAESRLDRRVREWSLSHTAEGVRAELAHTFGPTRAPGALRIVESIWGDAARGILLIAEEDMSRHGREVGLKVFGLDGAFQKRIVGVEHFAGQPEGIALWQCADGTGYWLASDQSSTGQRFLVFDRPSFDFLGAFHNEGISNTDGIWLQQEAIEGFPYGALYVVNDDQAVAAFDWRSIASALGLAEQCGSDVSAAGR